MLNFFGNYKDLTTVVLRVGLGMTMLFSHGLPKLLVPERWEGTGEAMASLGITFAPVFWGFMAAATETLGGLLLIVGLFTRPTAAVLTFVLFVAAAQNVVVAGTLGGGRAHPIDAGAGMIALLLLGAGKWSMDRKFGFDRDEAVSTSRSTVGPAGAHTETARS